MKNLRTARVLIIDDLASEAMPVVVALGRLGIGCVYVSGEKIEELEELKPFEGIRLAFVDMKLGVEGTAKEVVGKTVNVLKKVLAENTLPVMFVAWTAHPEYVDTFTETVRTELPFIRPLLVQRIPKPFLSDSKTIKVSKVLTDVKRILKLHWPLGIVWALEQMAHEAATETTQSISEVVSQDAAVNAATTETEKANAWLRVLRSILKTLVVAGAGNNNESQAARQGLLEAFNAMQFDSFQEVAHKSLLLEVSKLCASEEPKLTGAQKAALNGMLLLSSVAPSDKLVKPGNLYLPRPRLKSKCPVTRCKVKVSDLTVHLSPTLTKDEQYRRLSDDLQKATRNSNVAEMGRLKRELENRKRTILRCCIPVLLEVTPACDHAQKKNEGARFVAGVLIPDAQVKVFDWKKPFLKNMEPLQLPGKQGTWHLVLNARAFHSVSKTNTTIQSAPVARLREGIQNDIQAWFAAHAARPGYLSVH